MYVYIYIYTYVYIIWTLVLVHAVSLPSRLALNSGLDSRLVQDRLQPKCSQAMRSPLQRLATRVSKGRTIFPY